MTLRCANPDCQKPIGIQHGTGWIKEPNGKAMCWECYEAGWRPEPARFDYSEIFGEAAPERPPMD